VATERPILKINPNDDSSKNHNCRR
jgi:hypothetical protein